MTRIKMHISKVKLPFYLPCEVKYMLQNRVSTSYQIHRTISGALRHEQFEERDQEMERLRRLMRDLELEAKGRH